MPNRTTNQINNQKDFLTSLAILSSRLSHHFSHTKHLHEADYSRLDQVAPLLSAITDPGERLLIGKSQFGNVLAARPTQKRRELGNILVVAPTRGGKGLLAEAQLLTWPHSVIVNDIKGELYAHTAGFRKTFSTVLALDPRGVGHQYDPLQGKTTEDELYSVATQLLHRSDEGAGEVFTLRAIDMLTYLFLAAKAEQYPPFAYVREALRRGLPRTVERLQEVNPEFATGFLDVPFDPKKLQDKFLLHSFGTMKAKLKSILTEIAVRTLSGSDFTATDIITADKPYTIYLRWPEEHLLSLAPLIRLTMMISAYDAVEGKGCKPVLVLADEAGRTAIPSLADDVTTVVGRRISLWVSVQDLSQLESVYGKSKARTMLNNMDTQIFYRQSDYETALFLTPTTDKPGDVCC